MKTVIRYPEVMFDIIIYTCIDLQSNIESCPIRVDWKSDSLMNIHIPFIPETLLGDIYNGSKAISQIWQRRVFVKHSWTATNRNLTYFIRWYLKWYDIDFHKVFMKIFRLGIYFGSFLLWSTMLCRLISNEQWILNCYLNVNYIVIILCTYGKPFWMCGLTKHKWEDLQKNYSIRARKPVWKLCLVLDISDTQKLQDKKI